MPRNLSKLNRNAFGLIELTLALAVGAVIGFAVLLYYSNAKEEKTASEVGNGISLVRSAVENLYGGRRNYAGIQIDEIIMGLPKSMGHDIDDDVLGKGTLIKLGGNVRATIMTYAANNTNGNQLNWMLNMVFVSDYTCRKISTVDYGRNVKYIIVNNSPSDQNKLSVADSNQYCNQEKTTLGNMVQMFMN